ncbi:MAG: hypothetical protein ACTH2U_11190 [Brevibacterium sp.]
MEALFHLRDYGYEHLTELTLDGLLTQLTETTWVRKGAVLGPDDRMAALHTLTPQGLVLSHDSAWWVHRGLGRAPSPLSFITHPRRRFVTESGLDVHELTLIDDECECIDGRLLTTEERTLYDLLLPQVRTPGDHSPRVVRNLIDEVPGATRRRFRLYLDSVSRRPYVAQIRSTFERCCELPR